MFLLGIMEISVEALNKKWFQPLFIKIGSGYLLPLRIGRDHKKFNDSSLICKHFFKIFWIKIKSSVLFQIHLKIGLFVENSIAHFDTLNGLEFVVSTISMRATPEYFKNGKMKLRCLATMFDMYARSDEIELLEDTPKVALIMVSFDRTNAGKLSSFI